MALVWHSSPLGALRVPALGDAVIEVGQQVDVPGSVAEQLLEQSDLWHAVEEG